MPILTTTYLKVLIQDSTGKRTQTISVPTSIGRASGVDLHVQGTYVSRIHGEFFERYENASTKKIFYKDSSANGTFVNGRAISDLEIEIKEKDEIILSGNLQDRYHDFPKIIIQEIRCEPYNDVVHVSKTPIILPNIQINNDELLIMSGSNSYVIKKDDLVKLGVGGTATVYEYNQNGKIKAIKLYNDEILDRHRMDYQNKLQAMLDSKPKGLTTMVDGQEYAQFAWPEAMVYDNENRLCGYIMQSLPKSNIYNLGVYIRHLKELDASHHSITYRIQVARNLAIAINNLHKAGHYFIDVKPENIFVFKDKCTVCFIDCDGFSIQNGTYPAHHYSQGYQAPFVLLDKLKPEHLSSEPYQDYYCLAHLIFEILDFGNQPFRGVIKDIDLQDEMDLLGGSYDLKVEKGMYPYHISQLRSDIGPYPKSTYQYWPFKIRQLFDLAFAGTKYELPTALEWAKEFDRHIKERNFEKCNVKPNETTHHHFKGSRCPACDIFNEATNPNLEHNPNYSIWDKNISINYSSSSCATNSNASIITNNSNDKQDWLDACLKNTVDAYQYYLYLHPNGQFVNSALGKLSNLFIK